MADSIRVPHAERYSVHSGVQFTYIRCNDCDKHRFSNQEDETGWIYAFESKGLPDILGAVNRHDESTH